MDSLSVYKKCVGLVNEMEIMFNHFDKYQPCISVKYFNAERTEILTEISNAHQVMMLRLNFENGAEDTLPGGGTDQILKPADISNQLKERKTEIVNMLDKASEQRKATYLYHFEKGCDDIRHLVNRMQMMIRNCQQIFQPVLRMSA